jgi:hypothetical protein
VALERALFTEEVSNCSNSDPLAALANDRYQAIWGHCTVSIAYRLSASCEEPADKAKIKRIKATILRTGMPVSTSLICCEASSRVMCMVSDEVG